MRKKETFFLSFIILFLFSVVLFKTSFFSGIQIFFEKTTSPILLVSKNLFNLPLNVFHNNELAKLKEENLNLQNKLLGYENIKKENNALRDQFNSSYPLKNTLLPARIIGSPVFIPGVSQPEFFVLDQGAKNGVKTGQAVVYKDNLVGKVQKVSSVLSVVQLVTNKESSFTARSVKTDALGVVNGQGEGEIILDNVLLSDNLEISDFVKTKGDLESDQEGILADLIVGKIVSIDKKSSSLFQVAKIKSLLNFSKLTTVFIVTGYQK